MEAVDSKRLEKILKVSIEWINNSGEKNFRELNLTQEELECLIKVVTSHFFELATQFEDYNSVQEERVNEDAKSKFKEQAKHRGPLHFILREYNTECTKNGKSYTGLIKDELLPKFQHELSLAIQHAQTASLPTIVDSAESSLVDSTPENAISETTSASPDVEKKIIQASWNYLPVPGGLDEHTEFATKNQLGCRGYRLLGARARGKKHKHEGTNCDDWFEFDNTDHWNLIAVSDGAGSKKFSRVGAKAACVAALESLKSNLPAPTTAISTSTDILEDQLPDQLTQFVESSRMVMASAMVAAYEGIVDACKKRQNPGVEVDYIKELDREIALSDLYCTLLLTAETEILVEDKPTNLIITCQIGDGMTSLVSHSLNTKVLGEAESGEFSGQTEFVTSKGEVTIEKALSKTIATLSGLNCLMSMTDGVADDYFPGETESIRLFSDLQLNGILPPLDFSNCEPTSDSQVGASPTIHDDQYLDYVITISSEPVELPIASSERLAESLNIPIPDFLTNQNLLQKYRKDIAETTEREIKLLKWVDAYHVRGSFDDRTIVVMYKEPSN